jgi:hypothetical protein
MGRFLSLSFIPKPFGVGYPVALSTIVEPEASSLVLNALIMNNDDAKIQKYLTFIFKNVLFLLL